MKIVKSDDQSHGVDNCTVKGRKEWKLKAGVIKHH
jgi:hypothetical protein